MIDSTVHWMISTSSTYYVAESGGMIDWILHHEGLQTKTSQVARAYAYHGDW